MDIIPKLFSRISYLESLLTKNLIPFEKSELLSLEFQKPSDKHILHPSPFITNLESIEKLEPSLSLTTPLIERYSRQMLLPEISLQGQKKLIQARVLIIGAGGIGAPALFYLSGLGIGTIGIVDGDIVEESNLHRQILHKTGRVGMNKALSAMKTLKKFNPNINYKIFQERLNLNNCEEIIKDFDIILDASDNALTRYLLNDISIINKKILVSGSALGWEGQLTVYGFNKEAPCYRCLFPICPQAANMMSCGDAGVVGMVPGLIGLLEAMETLKIIAGVEGVLNKEMIIYDGIRSVFKKAKLRGRKNDCCVCGDKPSLTDVKKFDYQNFIGAGCSIYPQLKAENMISWEKFLEFYEKIDKHKMVLIDVRPEAQFNIVNIEKFKNIPLGILEKMSEEDLKLIGKKGEKKEIFIMCRRGNASRTAAKIFLSHEFTSF